MTEQEALRELMNRYNEARARWIKEKGENFDEAEFHAWFSEQATGGRDERVF
jgi:hypothetical protein